MQRCFGTGDPLYERYHDEEWGRPVADGPEEAALFERLALEGFQTGLSWITVLRKREAFRRAFEGFVPSKVAAFDETKVAELMADASIIRNSAKIRAVIGNARALVALHEQGLKLADIVAEHAPPPRLSPPTSMDEVPSSTPESTALSRRLKRLGFRFVGPVTMYATFQTVGLVDDHLANCWVHGAASPPSPDQMLP